MTKYSFEFKKKIVQAYFYNDDGYGYLAKKYAILDHGPIKRWVAVYKEYDSEGLLRSRKNETYSFDFKLHVVELYLTTEVLYQKLALRLGINNLPLFTKWVNDFGIFGHYALEPKRKEKRSKVSKPKDVTKRKLS